MPKPRTGQLILRKAGWYARVWTTIDGEHVRVCRALGTQNKVVAKRKLARMLEAENATAEDPKRPETFAEASDRIYQSRIAERPDEKGPREELSQLVRQAVPLIGQMPVVAIRATDINNVLDHAKSDGLSRQTVAHLKQRITNVFAQLKREGVRLDNPAAEAEMPKYSAAVVKERAVLTDVELACYLAWSHPEERHQSAVRERQTMACVSRMFGGIRTGDLHALDWAAFETTGGAFSWGLAPRQKTRRPQLLEVPAMLRPILHDWWVRAGKPSSGVVFPARRVGKRGDRVGQRRLGVSHAEAFRRDLQRAFKATKSAPQEGSSRWRELFAETEYTLPVDFHSWRRAFAQALADADVNVQHATALTGHASLAAHARYLRSAGKMRQLPDAALPDLSVVVIPGVVADEKALAKGSHAESDVISCAQPDADETESSEFLLVAASGGSLLSRRSRVRIAVGARDSEGLADSGRDEKAPTLPKPRRLYEAPAIVATERVSLAVAAFLGGAP